MQGWIKFHRQSLNNPLFRKPRTWHLWQYFLLKANHAEHSIIWNGSEMVIERGSFLFGRKAAAQETGLSEQNIRTACKSLLLLGMIEKSTVKSTNRFSYLTIVNYEKYQGSPEEPTGQLTSNQPASNQQLTTNNNSLKNLENVKKRPLSQEHLEKLLTRIGDQYDLRLTKEERGKIFFDYFLKAENEVIRDPGNYLKTLAVNYREKHPPVISPPGSNENWDE